MDQTIKFKRILEPFHESSQETHIDKIIIKIKTKVLNHRDFFITAEIWNMIKSLSSKKISIYFRF